MPQKIVDIDPLKEIETWPAEFRPPTRSLIILLGAFDSALNDKVRSVLSRVVAPVAVESGALILDDAGISGCAPLMAQAALEQDKVPVLAGIVTHDKTESGIDPNHELVLRLPPVWSDQMKYRFQLAAALAPEAVREKRVAALLFGGGETEKKALLRCARRGWPVLVVGKTGYLADEIISAGGVVSETMDPDLREILEKVTIFRSPVDASTAYLTRILSGRVASNPETLTETLREAWLRYDEIDRTAVRKQTRFQRLQLTLIVLAVLAVSFAVLKSIHIQPWVTDLAHRWYVPPGTLHFLVIVAPIALSIVAAFNSHFRDGTKWILLRGAAEALKREIFRCRALASGYSDEQCVQTSRESKLAASVADITSSLEKSEVNKSYLEHKPLDDKLRETILTPDQYVQARIQEQIGYFRTKTEKLARQLIWTQLLILIAGGADTLLAAVGWDPWVALGTAIVTAFTAKLQTDQTETSLVQYNQALSSLRNIEAWWKALSPWEKERPRNIDLLVDQTEKTLEAETAGWVQQMQSALEKLTEKEPQASGK